jgi:hypothetical protein
MKIIMKKNEVILQTYETLLSKQMFMLQEILREKRWRKVI